MFFISIGLLLEYAFRKFITKHSFLHGSVDSYKSNANKKRLSTSDKFTAALLKELPGMLGLLVFFCGAYFSYFSFIGTDYHFVQLLFLAVLLSITIVRIISILSKVVLSPTQNQSRILPINTSTAGTLYRLILSASIYIISTMMFSVLVYRFGAETSTVHILQLFFITLLLILTAITIFFFKKRVKEHLMSTIVANEELSLGQTQFASIWHILALLYIFILWLLLVNEVTAVEQRNHGAFILSFFVLPFWVVADKFIQWIVRYAMKTLQIHQTTYEDATEISEEEVIRRDKALKLYVKVRAVARVTLVFGFLIWIASLWNVHIPFLSNLMTILLDTFIIMTLALFFWQFVSSWIEQKIQESIPEEDENTDDDDEWGAASSRGRSYTLLPMVRKFIATVLVVMVTMTILSSMGVDIGPLLAGAGVIGIAIGFGAQKLVADMFSGFFYLVDDAFRVGEYMTAGNVSGSVEKITLRNVMLRHHRGMLQIVPHSELGAITNFMRGGIVVKFNLDFPYDADIDKIRKVIKKVGKAMLLDEEFGKDFIRPVKSQGVRAITNSVMTIRVKFTAEPGTHFVIRREAYKRITEALNKMGIYYAHKKVIVDIPHTTELEGHGDEKITQLIKAAGAAAGSVTTEETKPDQPQKQDDGSF